METFPHDVPTDEENVSSLFGLETPQFSDDLNVAEAKNIVTRSLPPSGMYTRDPDELGPLNYFEQSKDFDEVRQMFVFTGRFRTKRKGKEITAFVSNKGFKVSPDRRPKKEFVDNKPTGNFLDKDDRPSVLWGKAVLAYIDTYKEEPSKKSSVVEFLATGHYEVKIFSRGDLYVTDIKAVKGKK